MMHSVPLPDSLNSAADKALANLGTSSELAADGPDDLTVLFFLYICDDNECSDSKGRI